MELKWRKVYEIGIPKIDEQHKHLFELLKTISESPLHERGLLLKGYIEDLLDYANYHFRDEEKYWESINLPSEIIKHHKQEHKKYIVEINNIIKNSFGVGMAMSAETIEFLKTWIIDHILGEDQESARYKNEI